MADKVKKKKINSKNKITKKSESRKSNIPSNWFYMSQEAINVADIKKALVDAGYEMEIWEEAGVLEIVLGETASMDVEEGESISLMFEDEYSQEFLKEHQVKGAFYVTIKPDSYEDAQKAMTVICGKCGGFFCGDTEAFTPIVNGDTE